MRPLDDGRFQYVSNNIIEGNDDTWWRTERLTDSEWEEVYGAHDTIESDDSLWYLPQADDCLLNESERETVNNQVLAAAEQVREVYQDMEIEEGASYASNVKDFSRAQCKEVAALLGKAGFVSVTEDTNMENYQDIEAFYTAYKKGHDAQITIYNVNRDGLIGAITFIYKKDVLQAYYVGIGWQEGGVPIIKNTLVNDVLEIYLTEKGYFIYTYEEQIVHADARQYWRVKPLSEKCRELTRKYIAGISFTNYNAFVTNWNSSNVEEILMPCMFEDIYRIDTGQNIQVENDRIPAELYERIMMTYFPVSKEQLRSKCGYDADSDGYPYEMIFATPYAPFGEVVDYTENEDGTITLFVDGVWIDYNSDCAFTSEIVVKPFPDGTFLYLSNKIQPKELALPTAAFR
ncbi:MAG: ATP F0F1 synthase subunit B [Lachnospiraceae bacterium]|nr:ATP F0F1 synthase subunit B [Lachnospiraceae bacterium]